MEQFVPYERQTRAPRKAAPKGSVDTHFHVFGDPQRYGCIAQASYAVPDAQVADLERMHGMLGIERGVICQPTIYGTDHSLMLDLLEAHPSRYRGSAIIDETISDTELERMHRAGVRAARFNFARFINVVPSPDTYRRVIKRVKPLGWHIKIHGEYDEIVEHVPHLVTSGVPVVIDHMGRMDFGKGKDQPGYALMLDLLRNENFWMMLCNGDRFSGESAPFADTIPFARAFYEAAPHRTIWATDWPHVRYRRKMPNDADLLDLLDSYLPDDVAWQRVLVDNPCRLYGFPLPA